jgi:hypothetical protein
MKFNIKTKNNFIETKQIPTKNTESSMGGVSKKIIIHMNILYIYFIQNILHLIQLLKLNFIHIKISKKYCLKLPIHISIVIIQNI